MRGLAGWDVGIETHAERQGKSKGEKIENGLVCWSGGKRTMGMPGFPPVGPGSDWG